MQVGIDASNLRRGGGVTHLVELLRAAEPEELGVHRVIVWAARDTLSQITPRPWLERVHDPLLDQRLPVRQYWQTIKLSHLAQQACDILFVPGGSFRGHFRPYVTMSQNMLPFQARERYRYGASWMLLKLSLLRMSQMRTIGRANGTIFLTDYARSIVTDQVRMPGGKMTIISHGVNQAFRRAPRAQKPLSAYSLNAPYKWLYVSIVDVYKHQWKVAEAVAKLRQEGVPVELDLVGPYYPRAFRHLKHTLARLDPKADFIRYCGPVPHSQLPELYHQAHGFVFASSCENMPNILLEAMAAGLPIACSGHGPMPEVLRQGGVYFHPERSDEIAAALQRLMEDHHLRQQCAQEAFHLSQEYSWSRCARDTFAFLRTIYDRCHPTHHECRTGIPTC